MAAPPDAQRENWIYAQVASGNIPDWMRNLCLITTNAVINSVNHTVSYYVIPEYLAIGSDEDYFLEPMTPMLAQRISVLLNCTLPTRKMVNDIWTQTQLQMEPMPLTYNQTNPPITVAWFDTYNSNIWAQREGYFPTYPLGNSVAGDKKDVIISTYIYTNFQNGVTAPVVIYGWQYTDGTPIQPLYNGHSDLYMDYSHGIRMVQQAITVDGAPTTVSAVLTNPALAALLSDETVYAGNVIPQPYYTVGATAPVIITQPYSQAVKQGATVNFSVLSVGDGPLTYIWQLNNTTVASGTNLTLSLTNVHGVNAGTYSVIVSNAAGIATSLPAFLSVTSNSFPVLFSDNFDTDSSANWNFLWGANDNEPDYTTNWAYNYGIIPYTYNGVTYLVPPAPNSTNGTSFGVKFTVNNINGSDAGVNIYPKAQSFGGNFALKFDMWINYPGNAEGGGASGTTQYAIFGLNCRGTEVNWAAASASSTDGIWFGNDGDGGAVVDYLAYLGNLSGTQTELLGTAASGLSQSNHTTSIYTTLFPSPPSETVGTPGKTWAQYEIDQTNGTLIWKINGTTIAQRANTSSFTSGDIMLGLMDIFPSIANPASQCYVLYDNVRVENLSAAPTVAPGTVAVSPAVTNVNPGRSATFSVTANGTSPFSYQWFYNGAALSGQTTSTLTVASVQQSSTGIYYAQVSNGAGSALSGPAVLNVTTNWALTTPRYLNNTFRFTLLGLTNVSYVIDFSSNLLNWIPLTTNGPMRIIDSTDSTYPAGFYRARPAP